MDRTTGLTLNDEVSHIKQSVADILLTPKGTRLQRRTYGSEIFELLDRPLSRALLLQISSACVSAISLWEPRISVSKFAVQYHADTAHTLIAELEGVIKSSNTPLKTTLNLNLQG